MAIISFSLAYRETQSFSLLAEGLQVRPEQGGGQDKGMGDKGMSLYGQTLDWRGRGQLRPPISGDTRAARSRALSG